MTKEHRFDSHDRAADDLAALRSASATDQNGAAHGRGPLDEDALREGFLEATRAAVGQAHAESRESLLSSLPYVPRKPIPPRTEWRNRMLHRLTAAAAVLAILVAARLGFEHSRSGDAFAALVQMSERVEQATSVTFVTTEKNVLAGMDIVHKSYVCDSPLRSRSEIAIGARSVVRISDDTGTYVFEPVNKLVTRLTSGPGATDPAQVILDSVRQAVSGDTAQALGTRDVQGHSCQVYRVPLADGDTGETGADAPTTLELSVSRESLLPVRIVYLEPGPGAEGAPGGELEEAVVMSDFHWNEVLDASLFDTSIPEGWQLVDMQELERRTGR